MRKLVVAALIFSLNAYAVTEQAFKENMDVSINLSNTNYNRLVVKNDKIIKAHFPDGALAIRGEEDGSLYALAVKQEPFTLFITTEGGHHFSTTVNSEEALGKTIEFTPVQTKEALIKTNVQVKNLIDSLMKHMVNAEPLLSFHIEAVKSPSSRLRNNLTITPEVIYQGSNLRGEIYRVYNPNNKPIELKETWFLDKSIKAITISEETLAPKREARVYRI